MDCAKIDAIVNWPDPKTFCDEKPSFAHNIGSASIFLYRLLHCCILLTKRDLIIQWVWKGGQSFFKKITLGPIFYVDIVG